MTPWNPPGVQNGHDVDNLWQKDHFFGGKKLDLSFHWEYTLGKILHPFFISNAPPPPLEGGDVSFFNETMFQKLQNIVQMMHLTNKDGF